MKLSIKDLCVEIDKKIILNHFNLDIEPGSIHAIMGPNGVGKSTLSRIIMGDSRYHVIEGDILFEGESILKYLPDERSRKGIFLSMQSPMEIDGVSNQDFLRTAVSQKNEKKVGLYQFIKDCEKATDELSMNKDLIHRSLNVGFSGGEKKKNEVLQIKLLKPSFIILDELDNIGLRSLLFSPIFISSLLINVSNILYVILSFKSRQLFFKESIVKLLGNVFLSSSSPYFSKGEISFILLSFKYNFCNLFHLLVILLKNLMLVIKFKDKSSSSKLNSGIIFNNETSSNLLSSNIKHLILLGLIIKGYKSLNISPFRLEPKSKFSWLR